VALTLIEKEHLVDDVWTFRFKADEPFTWTAGQYISVELPHNNPDGKGTKRWFTISSAPYEQYVQITTRVTDSTFKQALVALKPGGELTLLDQPHGNFVWLDKGRPLVFVATGLGITPFQSILKQRAHDALPLDVTLIYNGRTLALPFKDELKEWMKLDRGLKVKYVIGERLNARHLLELVPALNESLVYISGAQPLMLELADALKNQGLPASQLKHELFPSYTKNNY